MRGVESYSLDGKRKVSEDLPVGMFVWSDEAEHPMVRLVAWGLAKGERMIPGGVGLTRGAYGDWTLSMLLPLSVLADPDMPIGMAFPRKGTSDIPVHIRRIDDNGGDVHLDLAEADPDLSVWNKDIFWQADGEVRIVDEVAAHLGKRFAFAFGGSVLSPGEVTRLVEKNQTVVETTYYTYIFQANQPIEVIAGKPAYIESNRPDPGREARLVNTASLNIHCTEPVADLKLVTRIIPKRDEAE